MKKVTLILPDKIMHVFGSSRTTYHSEVDLTPQNLIQVLTLDAYHDRFKFNEEEIRIVSIE